MFVIVGLGNPGQTYTMTKHNLGFRVVEALASKRKFGVVKQKKRYLWAHGFIQEEEVILAQPLTYMNLSGLAVAELVRAYSLPLTNLMVVCDDFNLELGTLRLRTRGGSGGHKGLASIIDSLGSEEFGRLRLGVGLVPPGTEAPEYVLSPFLPEEEKQVKTMVEKAVEALEVFVLQGIEMAMNRYNGPAIMDIDNYRTIE